MKARSQMAQKIKCFMQRLFFASVTSLCLIAQVNLAYAQSTVSAGLLLNGEQQFFDKNGNPLSLGTVGTYIPGTLNSKTTWSDPAQQNVNTNPINLDAGGYATIYGVGTYRQIVKDRNGNQIWDAVTQPGGVTINQTLIGDGQPVGTIKPWAGITVPAQYIYAAGQSVLRSTYSDLLNAITITTTVNCTLGSSVLSNILDTTQIPIASDLELPNCIAGTATVVSKTTNSVTISTPSLVSLGGTTAVFFPFGNGDGSTTFNIPDLRGLTLIGRTNMGGTDKGNISSTYYGTNPNGLNAIGGFQSNTLATGNIPQFTITPAGTIGGSQTVSGYANSTTSGTPLVTESAGAGTIYTNPFTISGSNFTFTGTPFTIGNASPSAISNIQPSISINYIIKALPDTNASTQAGTFQGLLLPLNVGTSSENWIGAGITSGSDLGIFAKTGQQVELGIGNVVYGNLATNGFSTTGGYYSNGNVGTNLGSFLSEQGGPQYTYHATSNNPYDSGTAQSGSTTSLTLANRSCGASGGYYPLGCITNDYVTSVVTFTSGACNNTSAQITGVTPGTSPVITFSTLSCTPNTGDTYIIGRIDFGWQRDVITGTNHFDEVWEACNPLSPSELPFTCQDEFRRDVRVSTGNGPASLGGHYTAFNYSIYGTGNHPFHFAANPPDLHIASPVAQTLFLDSLNASTGLNVNAIQIVPNSANPQIIVNSAAPFCLGNTCGGTHNLGALAAFSLVGNTSSSTGVAIGFSGTADQIPVINHAGTSLAFGALNLTASAAVSGILGSANGGAGGLTGLIIGNNASAPTAYAGASCTNQAITALSVSGSPTCSSITSSFVSSSTGSGNFVFATTPSVTSPILVAVAYASLPGSPTLGQEGVINDGKASNCGDASCTTWGTTVTAGTGALHLKLWYNGTNWTLTGK